MPYKKKKKWQKEIYDTSLWEKVIRPAVIERDKDICCFCGKIILKRRTIHHKEELNESNFQNWEVAFNLDNLVECHAECHNKHHERFGFKEKQSIVNDDLTIDYTKRKE